MNLGKNTKITRVRLFTFIEHVLKSESKSVDVIIMLLPPRTFAIGEPSLYVELVLPKDAFDTFCRHNKVVMMTEEQARAVDEDMEKWRYGDEGKPE